MTHLYVGSLQVLATAVPFASTSCDFSQVIDLIGEAGAAVVL
jgi:hypothetical protein